MLRLDRCSEDDVLMIRSGMSEKISGADSAGFEFSESDSLPVISHESFDFSSKQALKLNNYTIKN